MPFTGTSHREKREREQILSEFERQFRLKFQQSPNLVEINLGSGIPAVTGLSTIEDSISVGSIPIRWNPINIPGLAFYEVTVAEDPFFVRNVKTRRVRESFHIETGYDQASVPDVFFKVRAVLQDGRAGNFSAILEATSGLATRDTLAFGAATNVVNYFAKILNGDWPGGDQWIHLRDGAGLGASPYFDGPVLVSGDGATIETVDGSEVLIFSRFVYAWQSVNTTRPPPGDPSFGNTELVTFFEVWRDYGTPSSVLIDRVTNSWPCTFLVSIDSPVPDGPTATVSGIGGLDLPPPGIHKYVFVMSGIDQHRGLSDPITASDVLVNAREISIDVVEFRS